MSGSENNNAALDLLLARRDQLSQKKRMLLDALLHEKSSDPKRHQQSTASAAGGFSAAPNSPLVTLKSSGSKIPLFLVHALLGSVFHYHHLARLLDSDQPVYALQAPGLDGIEKPLEKVTDFATLYVDAIRSVQTSGPFQLGGYSLGGWIAFEMAQQLARAGEHVSLVLILGTDVPLSVSMPLIYEQMAFLLQYQKDFEKVIIEPFLSYEQRIKLNTGEDGSLPPLVKLVKAHNRAILSYEPRPYNGKVTLLETIEQQLRTPFDPSRGWKRLSQQTVETHFVPGNHLSMLNEPHVKELARKIDFCLDNT